MTLEHPEWFLSLRRLLFAIAIVGFGVVPVDSDLIRFAWIVAIVSLAPLWAIKPRLTDDYLQVNQKKILFKEVTSAKLFLGMLWIFDIHGDHVCIAPWSYEKDQMVELYSRISHVA